MLQVTSVAINEAEKNRQGSMLHLKTSVVCLIAFAILGLIATPRAFAEERDLGNHSKNEIKNACNAAGGELLGISESGSYGCEVASKGTMILCNKSGNCTGYAPVLTRGDHNKILNSLHIKTRPTVNSQAQSCPSGKSCCCTSISANDCELTPPGGCGSTRPIPILQP
jgi:hypothetical protein